MVGKIFNSGLGVLIISEILAVIGIILYCIFNKAVK